jgi:rRNA biogenesis protein RRP5
LTASVKSLEDHGYILDLGISDVSGFLSFKDAREGPFLHHTELPPGKILNVTVTAMLSNGRTCNVSVDPAVYASSSVCSHELLSVDKLVLTLPSAAERDYKRVFDTARNPRSILGH